MSADVFAPLREAVAQLIASQGSADPKQHLAARRRLAANGPLLSRLLREHAERGEDAARVDWMEANTPTHDAFGLLIVRGESWSVGETHGAGFNGFSDGDGPSLRAAIDAARSLSSSPHPTDNQT